MPIAIRRVAAPPLNPPRPLTPLQSALVNFAGASDEKEWLKAPSALASPTLARTLLPAGRYAGAAFAAIPDGRGGLSLWEARYDAKSKRDVAHRVGSGAKVGPAADLSAYAESIPLAALEQGTTPELLNQVPALVRKANDSHIYVRWPLQGGGAALFQLGH
jgi:hypothetical protein